MHPSRRCGTRGFSVIAGVDEVGRGALFGPVVAGAVILPLRTTRLQRLGLRDSKQLTREQREKLDREIRKVAVACAMAEVDAAGIDTINIYQASRLAMRLAVDGLGTTPDHLLIDALRIDHACAQTKLIYGDSLSVSIAAASVVAKVYRDGMMRDLDRVHPQYGLASHKGYATPEHRAALEQHGPCGLHRQVVCTGGKVLWHGGAGACPGGRTQHGRSWKKMRCWKIEAVKEFDHLPGRLMCVVAHPDDECFAFGGALALAVRAGYEVSVVCLTDGQAATNRGDSADGGKLGAMRRDEFARSCAVLGVAHHELLDYQDGKLEFANVSEAAEKIVRRMRTFKPQMC